MPSYEDTVGTVVPKRLPPNTFWVHIYLPQNAQKFKTFYPNARLVEIIPEDTGVLRDRILKRDPTIAPDKLAQRVGVIEAEVAEGSEIADLTFENKGSLPEAQAAFYQLIAADIANSALTRN